MAQIALEEIWKKGLQIIEDKVGGSIFELWFKPIKLIQIKEQQAILEIPNRFFREWIEDHYSNMVSEVLEKLVGHQISIKYRTSEKLDAVTKKADAHLTERKNRLARKGVYLNPRYTFENFVVGPSNDFVQAAAKAVSELPGKSYNPLFIYGGVGLGKTHLVSAIGNKVVDTIKDLNVLYVSTEHFINEVVAAFRYNKAEELRIRFRNNVDLLLIDDIQFIENKPAIQEELFHTINTLYENQKQIVLSSDRTPKEIKSITDRLRSRFSMGLIADIQPPGVETKIAIIYKKAELERIKIPEEVVCFLAERIKTNIREIEGYLVRLGARSSLSGRPIDLEMAKNELKDIVSAEERPVTIANIQKMVCEYFGLKFDELKNKRRTREIAFPRQIAMYLCKKLTICSLGDIGKNFGGKDHATVIYACKQIEEKIKTDSEFNRLIESLLQKIKS